MEVGQRPEASGKPRTRRVVMQRKVSAAEYEKHRETMEALGLDPSDPLPPPDYMMNEATQPPQGLLPSHAMTEPEGMGMGTYPTGMGTGMGTGMDGDVMGGHGVSGTVISAKEKSGRLPRLRGEVKQVSLQKRTICEQMASNRHERALSRWAEQQSHWENHAQKASQKTGRPMEQSVVQRAEEHREKLEVMELLDRAIPLEVKSGGHSWYHSLRGDGTRFVQIGNMFSGLHLPVKLHRENVEYEHVRKPLLAALCKSRVDEDGNRIGPRTWRDEEYLVRRLRLYQKKMEDMAPGKVPHDEHLELSVKPLRPLQEEDSMVSLGEFDQDMHGDQEDTLQSGRLSSVWEGQEAPAEQEAPKLKRGPHLDFLPQRLQFKASVRKVDTQKITLRNTGTAVVTYAWICQLPPHGFQEALLPDDPSSRFTCHSTEGQILPGHEVNIVFTFTSPIPGTFVSTWSLKTYPELTFPITEVSMHGVSLEADLLLERRQIFNGSMFKEQVLHQVQEIIDDVVGAVKLTHPAMPDINSVALQERFFEEQNSSLGLYYSPYAWEVFKELDVRIKSLAGVDSTPAATKDPPATVQTGPPKGYKGRGRVPVKKVQPPPMKQVTPTDLAVPTAPGMRKLLASVTGESSEKEKRELSLDLERAIRTAQRTPIERSPIYWHAYETVLEIAMQVPKISQKVRKSKGLEPWPCLAPLDTQAGTEEHQELTEKRQAVRGEAEVEASIWDGENSGKGKLEETFSNFVTGKRIANFSSLASEARVAARLEKPRSLRDRIQPYVDRVGTDSVELSGLVVVYEVDVGFLEDQVSAAPGDSGPIQLDITGGLDEVARSRLQGLASVMETSPLAVLIMAHLGELEPDADGAPEPAEGEDAPTITDPEVLAVTTRMRKLPSLEPLMDMIRDVTEGAASSVEFVPHDVWLGDPVKFAEKVRNEDQDMKVFLLENMAAFPEEKGVLRVLKQPTEEELAAGQQPVVNTTSLPWATREAWTARTFRELQPEAFIQDSFTTACQTLTSNSGLWLGAPPRYVGPFVETELASFVEALALPFKPTGSAAEASALDGAEEEERLPANLLVVLGGGGYEGSAGEEALLCKLELLVGLSRLVQHERDGLSAALGGELATHLLMGLLGIHLGSTKGPATSAARNALKDAIFQVLRLGVAVHLPQDLVCEDIAPPQEGEGAPAAAPPAEDAEGETPKPEKPCETFPLARAFEAASKARISMGFEDQKECFLKVDPVVGTLTLSREPPTEEAAELPADLAPADAVAPTDAEAPDDAEAPADGAQADDAAAPSDPLKAVPEGFAVRDIGVGSVEHLKSVLRRSRGAVWNGVLGVWDEEQWQKGTRGFMAAFEARVNPPDEEDEEEEEAEEDEEEEEDEEDEEGRAGSKKPVPEPEADFEVSVVIGKDSTARLAELMLAPASVTFASQSGDGLLRLLRGTPLPGLLACEEKGQGK